MFPVRSFDVEESDLFMVNRFVVHNFFNGDSDCTVQYTNVPRCSGYGPSTFAFDDFVPNNVASIFGTCYNFSSVSEGLPNGQAICTPTSNFNWYSSCSACGDSDSSTGNKGSKGQKGATGAQGSQGFSGPKGTQGPSPAGAQGAQGLQGAQGATGALSLIHI